MKNLKLSVCSEGGHPQNERTWSRTPFAVSTELEKRDCLKLAFNSSFTNNIFLRELLKHISSLYYTTLLDYGRGILFRKFNSYNVYKKLRNFGGNSK